MHCSDGAHCGSRAHQGQDPRHFVRFRPFFAHRTAARKRVALADDERSCFPVEARADFEVIAAFLGVRHESRAARQSFVVSYGSGGQTAAVKCTARTHERKCEGHRRALHEVIALVHHANERRMAQLVADVVESAFAFHRRDLKETGRLRPHKCDRQQQDEWCGGQSVSHRCHVPEEPLPSTRSIRVLRSLITSSICSSCVPRAVRSPASDPRSVLRDRMYSIIASRANSERLRAPSEAETRCKASYSSLESLIVSKRVRRRRAAIVEVPSGSFVGKHSGWQPRQERPGDRSRLAHAGLRRTPGVTRVGKKKNV